MKNLCNFLSITFQKIALKIVFLKKCHFKPHFKNDLMEHYCVFQQLLLLCLSTIISTIIIFYDYV